MSAPTATDAKQVPLSAASRTLVDAVRTRYATKAYDANRRLAPEQLDALLTLLRSSPSSVNSQPWHFLVAASDEARDRIAARLEGNFAYNASKVRDASHVVVLCARQRMDDQHLADVLAQEQKDGRFASDEARENQRKSRQSYVNLHRYEQKDEQHWMEKQVYLAAGTLLLGAAALGVDATPIEGFDFRTIDEEFGLRAQGYSSVVMVALGYHSDTDFNAQLPKSRLPQEQVITVL
ncbi:oxygen-insensitive NAD(P)H nitroreductase [Kerstersia sp.]|uniref:oxygen-insensitive NAD(P)H nitroreductase n=1 Tax=Kerstersia sp. TaxID=1930783 RepID=UPI003F91FA32